ncbi:MAG TPA: hypothetical protein VEF76_07920, partial [Patescibacteria group bacterium]|nr:hypothetical protein [Patescibacteria group bacterium]
RNSNTYYFYTGYPKDLALAVVKGTSCEDLRGNFVMDTRRRGGAAGDSIRWMRDWRQLLGGEVSRLEEWKSEQHDYAETWSCLPHIAGISHYLQDPDAELEWNSISLANGPILITSGQAISSNQVKVEKIFDCGTISHVFCATVTFKKVRQNYRIVCWECGPLKESAESLHRNIRDYVPNGAINHEAEFTLSGGHMVSEASFGEKRSIDLRGNDSAHSVFYREHYIGEYANRRWNRVVSLLERDAVRP